MSKESKAAHTFPPTVVLPALAALLVVLGVIGLLVATLTKPKSETTKTNGQQLQVIDGSGRYPQDNQAAAGALQGAARVDDLIQNKEADNLQGKNGEGLQQGTDLDALLESTDLNVNR